MVELIVSAEAAQYKTDCMVSEDAGVAIKGLRV
jgi:hypothetical protein